MTRRRRAAKCVGFVPLLAACAFALVQVYLLVVVGQIRKLALSRKKTGKEAK